jgi:pyridoxamine 5'-phosphate oxidase
MAELSAQTPRYFRGGCEAMALDEILTAIWLKLSHAVEAQSAAWRLPVLGSISHNGPDLRTVVLRELDADAWTLTCYTDSRSAKVRQLTANPRLSWLFYCPNERIQLRAYGVAAIATSGPEVAAAWESVPAFSRRNYLTEEPPGTTANCRVDVGGLNGDADYFATGINNFAILSCALSELVWLSVDGQTQVSAIFKQTPDGVTSAWRVP